ncbi:MAG: lipase [Xanthomonadaceae bacterium]|nr:lipase [Xanthomonadaceae bacterium]
MIAAGHAGRMDRGSALICGTGVPVGGRSSVARSVAAIGEASPIRCRCRRMSSSPVLPLSPSAELSAMFRSRSRVAPVLVSLCLLQACSGSDPLTAPVAVSEGWRTAWNASPSDGFTVPVALLAQTVRMPIAPHAAGRELRLRLGNRLGLLPAEFTAVYIGREQMPGVAALVPGSNRRLTFGGATSVRLAPGESALSDPIAFDVEPFERLMVSLDVPLTTINVSEHFSARERVHAALIGNAAEVSGAGFLPLNLPLLTNWLAIEAVEVRGDRPPKPALVTFGDSITDGFEAMLGVPLIEDIGSTGSDRRYPDWLQRRLLATPGAPDYAVVNAGISGNRVLRDGLLPQFGPSALSRLDHDVLAVPGLRAVIILEGTNDIGFPPEPAAVELQAGLATLVQRIKAHDPAIRVLIGTLTPARGTLAGPLGTPQTGLGLQHGTARAAALRAAVNGWMRSGGSGADGVIDFERCLADPGNPEYLLPAFDSSDHLHPNGEGYRAMADCIDLEALR